MRVNSQHKQYSDSIPIWQLVRDCDNGPKTIKSRSNGGNGSRTLTGIAGTAYLPAPNAKDTSSDNRERYSAYLLRASFVNFTAQTKEGVLGLVFRKQTTIQAPTALEYLVDDINGAGLTSDQLIKDVAADVLLIGRNGLLVDYPTAAPGMTQDQVAALNLRANILPYPAESIINWRTGVVGGVTKLIMVVLCEPTEIQVDDFEFKTVDYHRVLLLRDGIYVQNLYDDDGKLVVYGTSEVDENGDDVFTGDIIPTDATGSTWDIIPFTFVGSINNDPDVDKAPLYDIADVNIAHYRNSADYEESSFISGQPTLALAGLSLTWVKETMKNGVALGSKAAIMLPIGGSAELLQAEPNSMPMVGMVHKEQQLVMLGARLITDTAGTETKDAAKMRYAGQNSKMGSILVNVESAFKQCFAWAGRFMGSTDETEIAINKEFYDATVDPQLIMALIQLSDRGVIAETDLRNTLRKGNLIESARTDDDIDGDIDNNDPLQGRDGML